MDRKIFFSYQLKELIVLIVKLLSEKNLICWLSYENKLE